MRHKQWGEASTAPTVTKICIMRDLPDIITCVKFQDEILRGYNFTGEFPLLIFAWALQCSAIVLPVI